jgi:hypothetical protein
MKIGANAVSATAARRPIQCGIELVRNEAKISRARPTTKEPQRHMNERDFLSDGRIHRVLQLFHFTAGLERKPHFPRAAPRDMAAGDLARAAVCAARVEVREFHARRSTRSEAAGGFAHMVKCACIRPRRKLLATTPTAFHPRPSGAATPNLRVPPSPVHVVRAAGRWGIW